MGKQELERQGFVFVYMYIYVIVYVFVYMYMGRCIIIGICGLLGGIRKEKSVSRKARIAIRETRRT